MGSSRAIIPGLALEECYTLRKVRELPMAGELHVELGDYVSQSDIVASTSLPGDLVILKISEQMGLEPFEVIKGLKVREGDTVKKDALLCEHKGLFGLFKSNFVAPFCGCIELISKETGHIGLRLPSSILHLDAYVSGKVVEVQEAKSVTIEAKGAFIQGIFGIGGERQGTLAVLDIAADKIVSEQDIPEDVKGKILVGGMRPSIEALRKAQSGGAKAFVTASIDGDVLKDYLGYELGIAVTGNEEVSMSIIVMEGFGNLAFSDRALSLFRKFNGAKVSSNGATQVRAGAIRPELIMFREGDIGVDELSIKEAKRLEKGASVRLIRVPYFGEKGVIEELPVELHRLESGTMARVAKVKLSNGACVVVPRTNMELE